MGAVKSHRALEIATLESPCINVCVIDKETGQCEGCHRTIHEIARWSSMTPAERRSIMNELPARKLEPAKS
jgi:hypothetical protein